MHSKNSRGAAWLLTVLLSEVHSWGREHRVRYYIHLPTVERFADAAELTRLIDQLRESKLSKKEATAIREFKAALKRRAEGKADDAWRNERDGHEEEILD